MTYYAVLLTLLMWWPASAISGAGPVPPPQQAQCESHTTGGDFQSIQCRVDAASVSRLFRFKVNFSGGHDDTTASLSVALDGAPLTCDAASKTSLMGEDGEVSLVCNFSLAPNGTKEHVFSAQIVWGHAQFTGFEFESQ